MAFLKVDLTIIISYLFKGTYENNECDVKDKPNLDTTSGSSSDNNSMR